MKEKMVKKAVMFWTVIAAVLMSAVSLQAVMFPIVVNNCGNSSAVAARTVMFPIAVPVGNAAVGDAVAADVRLGKTFSSEAAGTGVTGTADFTTAGACTEAPVRATGQKGCYNGTAWVTPCSSPSPAGQDGALTPGVAWPAPRFTDNTDGTVTDNLTGLIWLKNADCNGGRFSWSNAMNSAADLGAGTCGLSDGSVPGDWRLPTVDEMISLLDREYFSPSLSNAQGTGKWAEGDIFSNVHSDYGYWTSTGYAALAKYSWQVDLGYGTVSGQSYNNIYYIWPVRDPN